MRAACEQRGNRSHIQSARTGRLLVGALGLLALTGCGAVSTQHGPLAIGTARNEPDTTVCISEVEAGDTVWFGERATNRSDADVTIRSVEAVNPSGLGDLDLGGRLMLQSDGHFMAWSERDADAEELVRATRGLERVAGAVVPPDTAYGIVITTTLEGQIGSIEQVRITYESGGRTYSSVGAVTVMAMQGECE